MNSQKMGFWAVTSLVAGSQIGTGIFLLPASLAAFGAAGLSSWLITATGALLLALVFARLSAEIPKTGGPHTFIESAFGKTLGFFSVWTYWVISWLSSPLVVVSIVSYLSPLLGNLSPLANLGLELSFLLFITGINLAGARSAGRVEFVLTLLKLLPLLLVPLAGIFFFEKSHFFPFNPTSEPTLNVLNAAALLTFWGFIGVESATTPADSVENPQKTIPRAVITGTLIVAVVYMFSSTMIMGVVPPEQLAASKAPFADAAQIIFGGNWYLLISLAASIVCLGTLNAWVLTSGQIALGGAYDGHLPKLFTVKNNQGAPKWALIISAMGMIPILILAMNQNLVSLINFTIEVSVTAFLFIYTLSSLSYLKLFWKKSVVSMLIGFGALTFCGWALYSSGIQMIALASLITMTGIPLYLWKNRKVAEDDVEATLEVPEMVSSD